jgi:hypothetical protein
LILEELLGRRPTCRLEDQLLSAVRYNLDSHLETVASIRNLRARHAVVTRDLLILLKIVLVLINYESANIHCILRYISGEYGEDWFLGT